MRYFVLAPTGERYGPADIATLNEWAAGNRLFPTSKLMEEMSGTVVAASSVAGLTFAQAAPGPMQPPAPGAPYQPSQPMAPLQPGQAYAPHGYMPQGAATDNGVKDMWIAFGIAVAAPFVGILSIYGVIIAIGGIQFAWKAMQKGQKWAILALILNILAIPIALYMRFVLRYSLLRRTY